MANKKLIIETEVKTDGIDKAAAKLGELKKVSNKISIQYDINGKPLDVVIDKSLNLRKQVAELTKALRSVREGSDEFRVLASALGGAQDQLAASNAKSRDLLGSLQLIPGPIGQIASQLNGAISALKLFSGFSLKDIGFQFKELNDDLNDIVKNLFGVGGAANKAKAELADTGATALNTVAEIENTAATGENTKAQLGSADAKGLDVVATKKDTLTTLENSLAEIENTIAIEKSTLAKSKDLMMQYNAIAATGGASNATLEQAIANDIETSSERLNTLEKQKNIVATEISTTKTQLDTLTKEANIGVTARLSAAVRALAGSVLFWVGVLAAAGFAVYKYLSAQEELNKEEQQGLDIQKKSVEVGQENLGLLKNLIVTVNKSGLTQREKNKAVNEYNEKLGETLGKVKTYEELEKKLITNGPNYVKYLEIKAKAEAAYALSVEATKAALLKGAEDPSANATFFDRLSGIVESKNYGETVKKQGAVNRDIQKKELEKTATDYFNLFTGFQKEANTLADQLKLPVPEIKIDDKKTDLKKIENDNKAANALLLKLQQENSVNILNEERKRQDAQLKIDKENEEREVNNLKLSKDKEGLRAQLLEQIRVKYGIKVIELNKKRQEEDNKTFDESQKKVKEYQDKIFEIFNQADADELSRNKAARTKKFEDDKKAIQDDTNFQKQSLEEKIRILLALEKAFNQDIEKLDEDEAQKNRDKNIKKLEDELRFLQIRGEALREGTKSFFDNQRAILKAAEQKELKDLEDRAIKEKLTVEQVEKEKLAIKEKYAKAGKDIAKQELDQYLQFATAILGAAQNIVSNLNQINQLQQQVATERLTKAYIEQNELDKKTITNAEQQEAKLLANKKKFAKDEDALKKKAFEDNKKIQIAQAIIGTLQGAVQAFQSLAVIPVVGPALGAAAAAAALIFGYKQVDLIKKTQYQSQLALTESETVSAPKSNPGRNYEKGGMIGGRRHAEGGTLIEAEKGEAIMTRGAVATFGPLLSLMNQAGGGVAFNSNLTTTRQDNPIVNKPAQEQAPLIVKTYVVSQELTTEAQRQARLKNLSTI
jgi:hypothetical protein